MTITSLTDQLDTTLEQLGELRRIAALYYRDRGVQTGPSINDLSATDLVEEVIRTAQLTTGWRQNRGQANDFKLEL